MAGLGETRAGFRRRKSFRRPSGSAAIIVRRRIYRDRYGGGRRVTRVEYLTGQADDAHRSDRGPQGGPGGSCFRGLCAVGAGGGERCPGGSVGGGEVRG